MERADGGNLLEQHSSPIPLLRIRKHGRCCHNIITAGWRDNDDRHFEIELGIASCKFCVEVN